MIRQLCFAVLGIGLLSVLGTPADAQLLSIGPGGVQYNGLGVGFYGPQYGLGIARSGTYSAYGNGLYGYGPAYGNGWNGAYRPLGWGRNRWGQGSLAYNSGYLGYSNPYYINNNGANGVYDYSQPLQASNDNPVSTSDNPGCEASLEAAIDAFKQSDYPAALDIINKGLVQCPHDPAMHEFRALTLFAKADYQQAAATIHSVLAAGPGWDWATLSSVYPSVSIYSRQLRALEAYATAHPQDGAVRFLLAYHYMVDGYPSSAAKQLEMVVRLEPTDRVAIEVLKVVSRPVTVDPNTGPQATTQPAITPTPATAAAKPIDQAMLVGTWVASRDDGSKFELALLNDGTFNWKVNHQETMQGFGGAYKIDGNILTLQRKAGGSLVAVLVLQDERRFNFKLQGGPAEDPGLNFSK